MPHTPETLFARLAELGIETRTIAHPPVFTVAESDTVHLSLPGGHTKNLFLQDARGTLVLVVAEQSTRVDLKGLHRTLGCGRLSFAGADRLMEVLGVTPGSVTAFAAINAPPGALLIVIDEHLLRHETINAHPLVNTATTNIAREALFLFIRATGHEPRVLRLERDPAP